MARVTEVLDYFIEPQLHKWVLRVGKAKAGRVGDEAKRIGTEVDLLVQQLVAGHSPVIPDDPAIQSCISAWTKHCEQRPEFVSQIISMQNELVVDDLTGHPDFIMEDERGWGVVDLKTSKAIQPKHWVQVAQYAKMYEIMQGIEPASFLGILRTDKESSTPQYQELTSPSDISYHQETFAHYYWIFKHAETTREQIRLILEDEILSL